MRLLNEIRVMGEHPHTKRARWPYTKLRVWQVLSAGFTFVAMLPFVPLLILYWLGSLAERLGELGLEMPPWSWMRELNSRLAHRSSRFVRKASPHIQKRRRRA